MNGPAVRVARDGPVATVALARSESRNALDEAMIAGLADAFTALSADPAVRVVTLRGDGTAFCAGANLAWMARVAGYGHAENVADVRTLERMFAAIDRCPKVTIARVQGPAMGGGAGLVAVCDLAVAAQDAFFAFPEVRLGLIPAVIAPYVVRKIGVGAARRHFVTGTPFTALEAHRIGLIDRTVTEEAMLDQTVAMYSEWALAAGPEAVAAVKELLRGIDGRTPEEAAATTVEALARLRQSAEGQEGVRAFLEKRKPDWAPPA